MRDADNSVRRCLDIGGELRPVGATPGPLKPDEAIALEAECREAYAIGEAAKTAARLIQARALHALKTIQGVHPFSGEIVPLWMIGPDGAESWGSYCFDVLGISKSEASRLCSVWEVYSVRLGYSEAVLQETPWTKLKEALPQIRASIDKDPDPDVEQIKELVFDSDVTTRQLVDTLRESRPVRNPYRVWWGRYDGEGRDVLLHGPDGELLVGRLTVRRGHEASDEEWGHVLDWLKSI